MLERSPIFHKTLSVIDMEPEISGLRVVASMNQEKNADIYFALEQAANYGATAVYFRFFPDKRPPRPQIYLFDFTDNLTLNHDLVKELHKNLWNAGVVPLILVHAQSEVSIFNCLEIPQDQTGVVYSPIDHFGIDEKGLSALKEYYSAKGFDSGLFWESEKGKKIDYNKSAYEQLLKQLSAVKNQLINRNSEVEPILIKRILVMLILIKYLEDRKDEYGNSALDPETFYSKFSNSDSSLSCVLRNGNTCLKMFDELASPEHFNGEIFKLTNSEKETAKELDFQLFALFVEGQVNFADGIGESYGQLSLWKLYSFNFLPIELISHIYEDFLADNEITEKKGVVYTPPYLVQFLVDRVLPLNQNDEDIVFPKVLDPACGSGIFLVGVFKRFIQRWRKSQNWKRPTSDDVPELISILSRSVYGCDIIPEAVRLSYFGLSLALLDALSPKEIWGNVHFENLLDKNLIAGDFFDVVKSGKIPKDFDLVIGNPPFESSLTEPAVQINRLEQEDSERPKLPDNQISLLFLEQSMKLLKEGGNCCLLLPSGPLLYNINSLDFRSYLLNQYTVQTIWDFTPLRAKLFKSSSTSAKPATLAVHVKREKHNETPVNHIIIRQTQASGEKIEFETDYYDIHVVSHQDACKQPKVWQTNLMGGGRLHYLMQRIFSENSLQEFINNNVAHRNWKVGEGWIEARKSIDQRLFDLESKKILSDEESEELKVLQDKFLAPWITNEKYVDTRTFDENGIGETRVCNAKYFYRSAKKNKEIFQPPHLLIKENARTNCIPVEFRTDYLTFKDKIIGIHCPPQDIEKLKRIGEFLGDKTAFSLIWMFSGQIVGSREGVPLKGDIFSIPYSENELNFSENEKILLGDVAEFMVDFRKKGEKSKALSPISPREKSFLKDFGATYCKVLNSVYKDFHAGTPIVARDFICYPFYLGEKPQVEEFESLSSAEDLLSSLLNYQDRHNLWIRRVLRVFDRNMIFLYKPNQKRYWLGSVAIKDADDTFSNLLDQGY